MKDVIKILSILLVLSLNGCKEKEKKLFWVSPPGAYENDFLSMAESTNVLPIDNLNYYLTKKELFSAEQLTFKNFGRIYKNNTFKVVVLFREGSNSGRDYTFIIRTFNHNAKILDSFELATWIESKKRYCFGSINEALIIKRNCNHNNEIDIRKILGNGKIVSTTYDERK